MKKKVLTIALAVALIAIVVSGSLAYFTAEDKVVNTFTIGSVLIEIFENNNPTTGDTMSFTKPMIPVVNAIPSQDESYIHKAVKVQSIGKNAAYVRTHIAIPEALAGYLVLDVDTANGWTQVAASKAVKDGVAYAVYTYDYTEKIEPGTFTKDLLRGVYLASDVDIKDNPETDTADLEFCKPDGNGGFIFSGFTAHSKVTDGYTSVTLNVLVYAQAIQAQGFENGATSALNSGFGTNTNPWQ